MVNDRDFEWEQGELYLLNDDEIRFVGRLVDLRPGPGDSLLLDVEVVWSPSSRVTPGLRVPCLPRWVVRKAVGEDLPPRG